MHRAQMNEAGVCLGGDENIPGLIVVVVQLSYYL